MSSKTTICNLALSHLGNGKEISNIETDQSSEGDVCRRYFDLARDTVLRDFPWPFATKIRSLSLIESNPNEEWAYSYQMPTDALKVRRILSGQRRDYNETREPYKILNSDSGLVIYADKESAEAEYTVRATDASLYPPDFTMALSWRLAVYIAPRITAGDPFNLTQRALEMYSMEISRAKATSVNEEQQDKEADSELERSRS